MPTPKPTWTSQPFLGLWLEPPSWQCDPRSFSDCLNVRITDGAVTNELMGWTMLDIPPLNGPVTMIAMFPSKGQRRMVLGTSTDLYDWHNGSPVFITPIYSTGFATASGATVTGSFTEWNKNMGTLAVRKNAKVGDQISFGSAGEQQPSATWHTITAVNSDTSLNITPPATSAPGTVYTIRQLAQSDAAKHRWSFEVYPAAGPPLNNDIFFCTNGLDPVVTWDGNALFAQYQADMPFLCRKLRRFRNLMIYGGLIQDGESLGSSIANSDNGLPLDLASGVAAQFVVSDGPYTINHLGILGNNLMIYMGDMEGGSVVAAQFVGFPTIFSFNEVIRGRGPIADNLVLEFPDRHEFIAMDGQYRYNGLYTQEMNENFWHNWLPLFQRDRAAESYVQVVPQFGLAHIVMPLSTDTGILPETALIENYNEQPAASVLKPITKRQFPFTAVGQLPTNSDIEYWNTDPYTWDTDPNRWNDTQINGSYAQQYAGDAAGRLYLLFTSDLQNGQGYTSAVRFNQRVTINERSRGLVRRIYPFINYVQEGYNIDINLHMFDQIGGQLIVSDTQTVALDYRNNRFTSHFRRGRVWDVEFRTEDPEDLGKPWVLTGWDMDISLGGLR